MFFIFIFKDAPSGIDSRRITYDSKIIDYSESHNRLVTLSFIHADHVVILCFFSLLVVFLLIFL